MTNKLGEHFDKISQEGGYFCPTRGKIICRSCFVICMPHVQKCTFKKCDAKFIAQDIIFGEK